MENNTNGLSISPAKNLFVSDSSEAPSGDLTLKGMFERFTMLSELEEGWYWENEGKVISGEWLTTIRNIIASLHMDHNVPIPYIYPLLEGGVSAEWNEVDRWLTDIRFSTFKNTLKVSLQFADSVNAENYQCRHYVISTHDSCVLGVVEKMKTDLTEYFKCVTSSKQRVSQILKFGKY